MKTNVHSILDRGYAAFIAFVMLWAMSITLNAATIYTVTSPADSGSGSLRGALGFAGDGDIIQFAIPGPITLTSGQLSVPTSVTISGPEGGTLVVNGNHASRVFNVTGTNVTISGLTIYNNASTTLNGAGIYASPGGPGSSLTLNNCVITNNSTSGWGGGIYNDKGRTLVVNNSIICSNSAAEGGGIFNYGASSNATLIVSASTLSGNRSADRGGGIYNYGYSSGNAMLVLSDSTLINNWAANNGGGIFNDGQSGNASLTNSNCTLKGNTAPYGGAIYNFGSGSGKATATINGGTVCSNSVTGHGGGIYNDGRGSIGATVGISNCLFAANRASGWGGVIFSDGTASGGHATLNLNTCTFSNNWAGVNGGGVASDGQSGNATLTVTNCLFAGNRANLGGGIHNYGYGGLATMTMEAGTLVGNMAYNGGAVYSDGESAGSMTLNIFDTTLSGNSATNYGGAIYNNGENNGNVTMTLSNCVLSGNWATNYAGGIENDGMANGHATLTLSACIVTNNWANTGGGILNDAYNSGHTALTLSACTISGNSANTYGGGIYNSGGLNGNAALTNIACTFSGNTAGFYGGAILNDGKSGGIGIAVALVTNSALTGNLADLGGAIVNWGNLTVLSSQFTNNVAQGPDGQTPGPGSNGGPGGGAAGLGGAIFSDGPGLTLTNSVFSANSAIGGHGGNGLQNGFYANPGGNGGGLNGGAGGAIGHAGSAGGFAGGGGGGAGSYNAGWYNGGAGGFGAGGGGGGAQGQGGSGGQGGVGGAYAGNGANAQYSTSGGGGGGAGLGGAVFANSGSITVLSCTFSGNLAMYGVGGASYYDVSGQGVGGALFSVVANVLAQNNTFNNNIASSYAPDMDWPFLVFSLADSGPGSLRQVLASATNGVTINFGVSGTITLTNGPLNVTTNVTLLGPGPGVLTVNGNNSSGVFNVTGTNVTLSGLTIANGYSALNGAGINAVGAAGSRLTLKNCVVTNNATDSSGGGIFINRGVTMVATNCMLCANSASNSFGGAIYNYQGTLTVVGSTLSANAAYRGGAIYNDGGSSTVTNMVASSTFSGNVAANWGGAIYSDGSLSGIATLKINASTFSGNSAVRGGVIYNYSPSGNGTVELGDTLLNVGAGSGGTIYTNSGTFKSDGYNLSSDAAGGDGTTVPGGFLNGTNDLRNTNPQLGPLQDNGGPTWTHALSPYSPAIDKGKANAVTNLACATDQRGLLRPVDFPTVPNSGGGDGSDIGALEFQATTTVLVTNDSGPGSLREAIIAAANGDTVTFASSLSGATILLTNGQLELYKSVNIDASSLPGGIILNANHASRVFQLDIGKTAALNSLTITNGIDTGAGNEGGAGILSYGSLTLNNCTVAGNSAASINWGGGGILTYHGALTLNQCTVSGNSANGNYGGAIFNDGSALTVVSSTLSGNSAAYAGGIYSYGGAIRNTILKAGASGANFSGSLTSGGYNLSSDASGAAFLTATGDQNNIDPKLGPLQNNGGPTPTHALLSGSPAIDQGNSFGLSTDQRGLPRPVDFAGIPNALGGDGSDIGAFEAQQVQGSGPFLLTGALKTGDGSFQFSFTNLPGATFTVFVTTNLALPFSNWTVLGVPVETAPGQFQFIDPQATSQPQGYYRLTSP